MLALSVFILSDRVYQDDVIVPTILVLFLVMVFVHINMLASISHFASFLELFAAYLPEFKSMARLPQVFVEDVAEIGHNGQRCYHDNGPASDVLATGIDY